MRYNYAQIRTFLKQQQAIRRSFAMKQIDAWEWDQRLRVLKDVHLDIEDSPAWESAVRDHVRMLISLQRGQQPRFAETAGF